MKFQLDDAMQTLGRIYLQQQQQRIMTEYQRPQRLEDLPDGVLNYMLSFLNDDLYSMMRLSWVSRFWRHFMLSKGDPLWCSLMVKALNYEGQVLVDLPMSHRLCELSGLDGHGLSMAVLAARERVPRYFTELQEEDSRDCGIIAFYPRRMTPQRLQRACADAIMWCIALCGVSDTGLGQFLWKTDRADFVITVPDECELGEFQFHVEGESAWTWNWKDRNAFLQDALGSLQSDCWFLRLPEHAPPSLQWMNGDARHDDERYYSILERIQEKDVAAVIAANSSVTLGMYYNGGDSGTNFCYTPRPSPRARQLNPQARYALHCQHFGEQHSAKSLLNELYLVAEISPQFSGFPIENTYPDSTEWQGWPFGFPRGQQHGMDDEEVEIYDEDDDNAL